MGRRPVLGWRRIAAVAGVLAAATGAALVALRLGSTERTDDAQVDGTVVPVQARVAGFSLRVLVVNDQKVRKGDTLYSIDPTECILRLRQADAELQATRAASRHGVAGASTGMASAQRQVAASNLEAAKANLERTQIELERTRSLRESEIASQSQLDAAVAAERTARAALRATVDQAEASGYGEAGAQAQERLADARIAAAQAGVDAARIQLSWTVGIATVSGHVARRSVEEGQFLAIGQPVLAIVSEAPPWVMANFKETQVERIRPGQAVDVDVDAVAGRTLRGRVKSIQWATGARFTLLPPDNASGNFTKVVQRIPVRIDIEDSPLRLLLRPGMSASVSVHVGA